MRTTPGLFLDEAANEGTSQCLVLCLFESKLLTIQQREKALREKDEARGNISVPEAKPTSSTLGESSHNNAIIISSQS